MTKGDMTKFRRIASPGKTLSLEFCPEIGGCITSFRQDSPRGTIDLFRPYDPRTPFLPGNTSNFPMTPFTNRISRGQLHFKGQAYPVGPLFGEENNALHGDGWTSPWTVAQLDPHSASLSLRVTDNPLSPYRYDAEQRFHLSDDTLELYLSVTNRAAIPLPFGIGHHPYFNRSAETTLKADMKRVWLCDAEMVPTRLIDVPEKWNFSVARPLSDDALGPPEQGFRKRDLIDNCFTDWDRHAEIINPETRTKITIRADPVFQYCVIYVPPEKPFFVYEAVTNIIDGFNMADQGHGDTGTIVLHPGQKLEGSVRYTISPLA